MTELKETIQESVEQAPLGKLNSRIALLVAFTATFMALCNIKDGNLVQAMEQAQARSIDAWSYFQAKSTKEAIVENSLEGLETAAVTSDSVLKVYKQKIGQYEKEKAAIKQEAEGFQNRYDALNVFDDQFDMTEALLSIAIALFGITALTQKKWLFYFAASLSLIGFILGITAFWKISLHSDFISRLLG